ncbi:MBL fold metallo-hydrolase [Desulfolucanica intricata]|uniref:MBL fold metallo-hydrolase n=1 Tax=Desulfolucanica intricata TaxID=1285191 RepID=UPI0008296160|nr:MBL fold metallo-hydrolase [Desulfolucanica intricata]
MLKLTTLSENSANKKGYLAEHGLSILVEYGDYKVIFDTGQGISAAQNADKLGVNLREINDIALSHGHFDHTGGLKYILDRTGPKNIYTHPDSLAAKYRLVKDNIYKAMGLPYNIKEIQKCGANFILNSKPVELYPGVILTGEIPRKVAFEPTAEGHVILEGENYRRDFLLDDQALSVTTPYGLVVILGCAHAGIINTLCYIKELTGTKKIFAVVGGTHLIEAGPERLELTISALKEMEVEKIAVSHCTGFRAQVALQQAFGEDFILNNCGNILTF